MNVTSQQEGPVGLSNTTSNKLRAAVLGANDGIVSVAGLVVGVAGASSSHAIIFTAGMAGLVAGALSMAVGEYISVSSQRDSEHAALRYEEHRLATYPDEEIAELAAIYRAKGLSKKTAEQVAKELTKHDVLRAHAEAEHGIDPDDLTNPMHAAVASASAFTIGALIPLISVLSSPESWRVPVTFVAVIIALILTGTFSGRVSNAKLSRSIPRVVIGGTLAMVITYGIGHLFGVAYL